MKRLMLKITLRGSATAWSRASRPTTGMPSAGKWITEGTRPLRPSGCSTTGRPSLKIAASEFVVPRSMPNASVSGTVFGALRTFSSM